MQEVTNYICDCCGEYFENEFDCLKHELGHKLEKAGKHIKFFFLDGKRLTVLPINFRTAKEVNVIFCENDEAAWETIDELFDYTSCYPPDKSIRHTGNYFVYDYYSDAWYCLNDRLHNLTQLYNRLEQEVKGE